MAEPRYTVTHDIQDGPKQVEIGGTMQIGDDRAAEIRALAGGCSLRFGSGTLVVDGDQWMWQAA